MAKEVLLLLWTCLVAERVHTVAVPVHEVRAVTSAASVPSPEQVWFPWGSGTAWGKQWILWWDGQATPALAVLGVKAYPRSKVCPVPVLLGPWAERYAVAGLVKEDAQWLPLISRKHTPRHR